MRLLGILLAALAGILWGVYAALVRSSQAGPGEANFGVIIGTSFIAISATAVARPDMIFVNFTISIITGILWSIGMLLLLNSLGSMGISRAVPLTGGLQLLINTLFGIFVMGEWRFERGTFYLNLLGCMGILAGTCAFYWSGSVTQEAPSYKSIGLVLAATIFFIGTLIPLRYFRINGFAAVLPQSIGMLVGGTLLLGGRVRSFFNGWRWDLVIPGLVWGLGNLGLILSLNLVGLATSFALTRLANVISTLCGLYIFNEARTRRQRFYVWTANLLTLVGSIILISAR